MRCHFLRRKHSRLSLGVCRDMQGYTGICRDTQQGYSGICRNMQEYAGIYSRDIQGICKNNAEVCRDMQGYAGICRNIQLLKSGGVVPGNTYTCIYIHCSITN